MIYVGILHPRSATGCDYDGTKRALCYISMPFVHVAHLLACFFNAWPDLSSWQTEVSPLAVLLEVQAERLATPPFHVGVHKRAFRLGIPEYEQ